MADTDAEVLEMLTAALQHQQRRRNAPAIAKELQAKLGSINVVTALELCHALLAPETSREHEELCTVIRGPLLKALKDVSKT
eukprot:3582512-Prymnesium_polylepis.1